MWTDEDAAIIEPRKGKGEESLPSAALFVFTPQDVKLLLKGFPQPPALQQRYYLVDVYRAAHRDCPVTVAGPALGAPQAVMVMERLFVLGVTDLLAVGWCGSLQPDVRIGDVVLPVSAVSEEGTSKHYPADVPDPGPSPDLVDPFGKVLGGMGIGVHRGRVWSIDAPFREMKSKVLKYQSEGVLAVDMETSALFALAHFRGVRLAVALVVSDDLSTLRWHHGFRDPGFQRTREQLAKAAIEFMCSESRTGNREAGCESRRV